MNESEPQHRYQARDSINEFTISGEFGFLRVEGPFTASMEAGKWTITIPDDFDDGAGGLIIQSLNDKEGEAAVLFADCVAIGGGVVEVVDQPDGEDETHVVVNQGGRQ